MRGAKAAALPEGLEGTVRTGLPQIFALPEARREPGGLQRACLKKLRGDPSRPDAGVDGLKEPGLVGLRRGSVSRDLSRARRPSTAPGDREYLDAALLLDWGDSGDRCVLETLGPLTRRLAGFVTPTAAGLAPPLLSEPPKGPVTWLIAALSRAETASRTAPLRPRGGGCAFIGAGLSDGPLLEGPHGLCSHEAAEVCRVSSACKDADSY